ncbi:MAG: hypothetical protein ACJAWL_000745 [Motiliproteus sp.]
MNPNPLDELQQWIETQTAHCHSLLGDQETQPADWQALLDSSRTLTQQQPDEQRELTESMVQQARGFSRYGERLLRALKHQDSPSHLDTAVRDLSSHLQLQAGEPFYRQWQLPEPLQQTLQQFGLSPSGFSSFPFLHSSINRNKDRHQQQLQQMQHALNEFTETLSLYIEQQNQISQRTSDSMILQLKQQEPAPESLAELHQTWVDCYEQCYHQQLGTPEYQQIYGRLGNAILALQQQAQDYWKKEYQGVGLVPSSDYDELLRHHHKLRKSHKQSQRQIKKLEQALESQQQQLTALQQQQRVQQSSQRQPSATDSPDIKP